jgi:O-antigen/teichoic acid export membrane protein
MFSSIFIDAWQLSAVDEYDNDGKADFFTKVFRVYSGGVFTASSALIVACQIITKILVASSYYDSWQYVPVLIIATTLSCFVNFLASVYMASKKTFMGMVTALSGAVTNVILNLILIPKIGANGAAIATMCAFVVVFVTRGINTRKYVKIDFNAPVMIGEFVILGLQAGVMLYLKSGIVMYAVEVVLFIAMALLNMKPIIELFNLIFGKFVRRIKKKD